jgi:DtxR family Mn-dependent transcriptional regulator
MPTHTAENYLKAILALSDGARQPVSLGQVGERVGVTPGTVTTMMRQLAEENLVDYAPRRGVWLTSTGRTTATHVLHRHRLIELFLVQIMKLDWAHVHEEAEVLEHVVSDRLLQRIDEMLGHPSRDPHGDPIPDPAGAMPQQALTPLSECSPGEHRVMQVIGDEPRFLEWLEREGLRPGAEVRLEAHDALAQTVTFNTHAASNRTIGAAVAAHLLMTPEQG